MGIHEATLAEIGGRLTDNPVRLALFEGLKQAIRNLQGAGVRQVFIDGSFVTSKPDPGDIDGCWEGGANTQIEKIDPVLLDFSNSRSAMKQKYGVDLFPQFWTEAESGQPFVEFFQTSRNGTRRGILVLDLKAEVSG